LGKGLQKPWRKSHQQAYSQSKALEQGSTSALLLLLDPEPSKLGGVPRFGAGEALPHPGQREPTRVPFPTRLSGCHGDST